MRGTAEPVVADQLRFDNRFRLIVSCGALAIAGFLVAIGLIPTLQPFLWIFAFSSIPYLLSSLWLTRHDTGAPLLRYGLSLIDFAAITAAVKITGGPESPFFYLYPIPFLIHALHFDIPLILWDGVWSVA